ncbi:hypothetical protein ACH5RR_039462 [Cinchona calisaya]|uniref:Uncharacterized protein n=1 Tax=Cinchona calisaya TaxID=153742 RepID=A0ABD2XYC6_9GENT
MECWYVAWKWWRDRDRGQDGAEIVEGKGEENVGKVVGNSRGKERGWGMECDREGVGAVAKERKNMGLDGRRREERRSGLRYGRKMKDRGLKDGEIRGGKWGSRTWKKGDGKNGWEVDRENGMRKIEGGGMGTGKKGQGWERWKH